MSYQAGSAFPLNRTVTVSNLDLGSAITLTAEGPIGSVNITLDGVLAHGSIVEFTLNNTYIESNSMVATCAALKGTAFYNGIARTGAYNVQDGSAKVFFQNNSGVGLVDGRVIYIAWEILN